jgi:hypothetical protein
LYSIALRIDLLPFLSSFAGNGKVDSLIAKTMDDKHKEELRKLFPDLSDEELEEAAQNQDDYLELAWEVFEELPPEKKTEVPMPKKRVDSIYRRFDSSPGCS